MTQSEIYSMIEEEGVEFIRLQFTDIFGVLKNIAVTPSQMEKVLSNRYSFDGSAAFGNRFNWDERLYLYPDIDTFMILPWRPQQGKVAKITCDIRRMDGSSFEYCTRTILKRTLMDISKRGYTVMADPECEFFLFHTDENGLPTTTSHELAGYMDVGPADFGENARRDIVLMLEEMGFEIESSHHESAPAQHEIDFKEGEAMRIADMIQTFRFAVRSIAKRFGLYATFMPKPKTDVAGSGMHINFALIRDGKNVFRSENGGITEEARYFIGGLLAHADALAAVANPTVNSYKRLAGGYRSCDMLRWACKGEKTLIKLNEDIDDTKIELRFPDGSANPYLLFACALAAGMEGIENRTEPGEEMGGKDVLPDNIREAVGRLQKDETLNTVLGRDFVNVLAEIKNAEWSDFMSEVSEWELARYLNKI